MTKILLSLTYLFFSLSLHAGESLCTLKLIKNEVSKFHGPEWNKTLQLCSKLSIKSYLKQIVENPQETLGEYDLETQKFLYRNSVKSYGHFGKEVEDLKILAALYNNKNNHIDDYFGENANLFRITILEAMANTGNLESLNFFQKILENDNNVLFIQQSAANFAAWVIEGSPLKQDDYQEGSKIFGEYFFPNLQLPLELRIKNAPQLLEKFYEKKITFKNLLQDMLLRQDRYGPIAKTLKKLQLTIDNQNVEIPQPESTSTLNSKLPIPMSIDESKKIVQNNENFKKNRVPASAAIDENNSEYSHSYALYGFVLIFLIACVILVRKFKN